MDSRFRGNDGAESVLLRRRRLRRLLSFLCLGGFFFLLGLLFGDMAANQAASDCPGHCMMSCNVANNRSCCRALEAAGGRCTTIYQKRSRYQ